MTGYSLVSMFTCDDRLKKKNFLIMVILLNIDSSEPQTEVLILHTPLSYPTVLL